MFRRNLMKTKLREFHEYLLPQTVEYAKQNSIFFRNLYHGFDIPLLIENLESLPIVTKKMLLNAGETIQTSNQQPVMRQHTSGSTATPLQLYRSQEEFNFLNSFHASRKNTTQPGKLVLALKSAGHGACFPTPCDDFVFQESIYDKTFLRNVSNMLISKYKLNGFENNITILSGLVSNIQALTAYLVDQQFDFHLSSISTICVTGTILTSHKEKILQKYWKNPTIVNRYSLTECYGGATLCPVCNAWHFDPEVIPEIVDLKTLKNVKNRYGMLLVTSLFPFTQMQPIIRYKTGDIAKHIDKHVSCESPGEAYELMGREHHSIITPEGELAFSAIELENLFDSLPYISRESVFLDLGEKSKLVNELGPSKVYISQDPSVPDCLVVKISCRFMPDFYKSACDEIIKDLKKSLQNIFKLKKGYTTKIQLCGPGSEIPGYRPAHV